MEGESGKSEGEFDIVIEYPESGRVCCSQESLMSQGECVIVRKVY